MMFLGAVAAFLSMVWLTYYIFVTLDNALLGLASLAVMAIGFMLLIKSAQVEED